MSFEVHDNVASLTTVSFGRGQRESVEHTSEEQPDKSRRAEGRGAASNRRVMKKKSNARRQEGGDGMSGSLGPRDTTRKHWLDYVLPSTCPVRCCAVGITVGITANERYE